MHFIFAFVLWGLLGHSKPSQPAISDTYQSQFKTLVIRQKEVESDEALLKVAFAADEKQLSAINAEGQALEAKLMQELGLDPSKYTVQYKDGNMQIVERTIVNQKGK